MCAWTAWDFGLPLQWSVVLACTLAAAATDLRWRRIPNSLTLPMLLSGVILATACGGWSGLVDSLAACLMLALPYVLLFVFAGGGAGDAKLMGAVGAWVGVTNGVAVLLGVSAAAVLIGLGYSLIRGRFRHVMSNIAYVTLGSIMAVISRRSGVRLAMEKPSPDKMLKMPYGLAIFVGVCLAAGGLTLWRTG